MARTYVARLLRSVIAGIVLFAPSPKRQRFVAFLFGWIRALPILQDLFRVAAELARGSSPKKTASKLGGYTKGESHRRSALGQVPFVSRRS